MKPETATKGTVVAFSLIVVKQYGGSSTVFAHMVLVIAIGVLMYLTMYYLLAGVFLGYKVDLAPSEFLLLFIKSGIFFIQYIVYMILYLLVSFPLLLIAIIIDEKVSTRPRKKRFAALHILTSGLPQCNLPSNGLSTYHPGYGSASTSLL
jgi:hypothetical protein